MGWGKNYQMKKNQFRNISYGLFTVSGLIILFLIWLSFEAASETKNWKFLDFDFEGKEGVISSYGSLLAAILSFISILYVLLDLAYQRRLKSQEEEYLKKERKQKLKDNLNIIRLFIDRLKSNSINQFKQNQKKLLMN